MAPVKASLQAADLTSGLRSSEADMARVGRVMRRRLLRQALAPQNQLRELIQRALEVGVPISRLVETLAPKTQPPTTGPRSGEASARNSYVRRNMPAHSQKGR
jgi:hypothetical protein